ncbi:hypothetical protein NG798_11930 [Ancylothrix sp. C2]|uniref:hypothetical protein n=1 Tax=Ancylothrix sp. D3o TaxID=2953691 RepID=UPI0021BBA6F0|nr:hypothetical protein [Ancylothrix sp. D3o]MCT7950500.1 hypothetical protein [Ancylothrix sp. D3o]
MSVRDAIFPIVLTVSLISTNYKTAVSASSTPLQLPPNVIEVAVKNAENTPPSQPTCPNGTVCP